MNRLLARHAESIFWLARYMERAENLARILDVNETFARDSRGGQNWFSIVQLNTDEERFFASHERTTADAVVDFYVLDGTNPTSILSTVRKARENARMLRHLISTEMWTQVNVFFHALQALRPPDVARPRLPRLCAWIKESCQAHTGITEGTFYRDQGWCFYQLGKYLERADQTTRILDIKYHLLLPNTDAADSPLDASQWAVLLRSTAGYHAFRRVHPRGLSPETVSEFMLYNQAFPRSVSLCVRDIDALLLQLKSRHGLRRGNEAMERTDALRARLTARSMNAVLRDGLHEFLDGIQQDLIGISREIGRAFFGHA